MPEETKVEVPAMNQGEFLAAVKETGLAFGVAFSYIQKAVETVEKRKTASAARRGKQKALKSAFEAWMEANPEEAKALMAKAAEAAE